MSKILFKAGLLVSLPVILSSCALSGKVEKRYKTQTVRTYPATKDSIKYFVAVNGYATSVPAKHKTNNNVAAKNIFSLSGEGQKQLIEAIADNEESTEEIYNKLAQDIIPEHKMHPASSGGRKFNKRIVLAIDDLHLTPADKIQKLTVTLAPKDGTNIKATACNKLTNNYHKPAKDVSGAAPDAISQSGLIADNGVVITLSNMDGNEMTGNVTADVIFEYTGEMRHRAVFSFANLWGRDKSATKPNEITATQYGQNVPTTPVSGNFSLSYTATVRHIVKGDNTVSESDDVVEIITGKTGSNDITIANGGQLTLSAWEISFAGKRLELAGNIYNGPVLFSTAEEAQDFLIWLKRSSADILANNRICNGDYKIVVSGDSNVLTDSFIENCKVAAVK